MKRIFVGLIILCMLGACSRENPSSETYQPLPSSGEDLKKWADLYPNEFSEWEGSVHGQAYLAGDTNAPACGDCHTDLNPSEISTVTLRLEIPTRCARCHSDQNKMRAYDLSAEVYDTYKADYHGATIEYYRAIASETYRPEAVCSDCHGNHAIYSIDDERSSVHPANLLTTCQKCHPEASDNFTSAFSHYRSVKSAASSSDPPVLFWVKLFYQILIPVVLGSMMGYILLDIVSRVRRKKQYG